MSKLSHSRSSRRTAPPNVAEQLVRVRLRSLEIPPIKDGLVIGRDAAIGGEAMTRTLRLMTTEKFERIAIKDEVVEDIVVRVGVLKKLGRDRLIKFVVERVKPVMSSTELLMLDIDIELIIEDSL